MAISFSLNAQQLSSLQFLAKPGESLNLAAKRLLLSILDELLSPTSPEKIAEISDGSSNNQITEPEPTLDTDLTSTEWWLKRLDDRIKAIEIGIEANHYPDQTEQYCGQTIAELQERIDKIEADRLSQDHRFGVHIESLEDRIEKLETEIEMITTPKQPATPNNELVIFLADSEGDPIQFWSGQIWADNLDLAYRYKSRQALTRTIDKLKKRKLPGNGSPGTVIAFAPIENLPENGKSWKRF